MESRTSQLQGETVSHHCQYGRKTRKSCPVSLFCLPKGCCISGPLDFAAFLLILTQPFYSRRKSQSCLFSPLTSAQIPLFLVSRGVTSGNPSSSPEGPFPPPLGADSSLEGSPPPQSEEPQPAAGPLPVSPSPVPHCLSEALVPLSWPRWDTSGMPFSGSQLLFCYWCHPTVAGRSQKAFLFRG